MCVSGFSHFSEAIPDPNGCLVQDNETGLCINPLFSPKFTQELHYLIRRSYYLTHRGKDAYDYRHSADLMQAVTLIFNYRNNRSIWECHRPLTGTHGSNHLKGLIGLLPHGHGVEVDYPGFVAYHEATATRPPIIAIIFRGSQSHKFQPGFGLLGPSWLTNLDTQTMLYPDLLEQRARFHKGYLEKYLAMRNSLFGDLHDYINMVPEELRKDIRFIVTGHSQGAGLVLPAALDITYQFGQFIHGKFFNNQKTPRFFAYMLSGPNSIAGRRTKKLVYDVIGKENILRHCSILDAVTYSFLSPKSSFKKKLAVKACLGGSSTFYPVGYLAMDDLMLLYQKAQRIDRIEDPDGTKLRNSVKYALKAYKHFILSHQYFSPYHKMAAYIRLRQCIYSMGGLYRFIAVNHYGSCHSKQCDLKNIKDDSYGFDPRLVECNLNHGLKRGKLHHDYAEKIIDGFYTYKQVFYINPSKIDRKIHVPHYEKIGSVYQ